ncbi:MAG: 50S ribosomal protein L17 [Geobacteraceae bacterium]|nr:50S ribosomal protein L17 [Geobacteraceae bacterium]
MRHNKSGRRLGRTTSHRIAMFRNMVTSFLNHERITTTDAKAKELRSIADKMITLGKRGDLHSMRLAASYIREKSVVTKLFTTIAPRYTDRPGGYTRIVKLGLRPGDNAQLSMIELVEEEFTPKVKKTVATAKIKPAVKPASVVAAEAPVTEEDVETVQTTIEEPTVCEAKAD